MKTLRLVWRWARRLPTRFVLVLVGLFLAYLLLLARLATSAWLEEAGGALLGRTGLEALAGALPSAVRAPLVELAAAAATGVAALVLLAVGALVSYNLAALLYRRIRRRPTVRVVGPAEPEPGAGDRLAGFDRIGLILAGGGAKGAYQAGALKAIHEFLEAHGALDRVAMVAGTSIGAWNAMFWLAGLVKPPAGGGPSLHERWWREISLERIVEFDTYRPLAQSHFLRSTPWEETFRQIFVEEPAVRRRLAPLFGAPGEAGPGEGPPPHFYLTRSNVELGHLEFATNWAGLRERTRPRLGADDPEATEPLVEPDRYEVIDDAELEAALGRTRRAVFASMDLPPLFPYRKIRTGRTEWFEDGGVVDNLPVRFGTEIERCDLLFVLPLNASFAEPVDRSSITRRLLRVMDVRQGVMERSSLKLVYLYNELAALRRELEGQKARGPDSDLERTARRREHEPVSIFSIVPEAPLALGTAEFWKAEAAGEAFDLLYEATRTELAENFERDTDPSWIRMTRVSPVGERTHVDDF